MGSGIKSIDVHGLNLYQAKIKIDSELRKAKSDVYRIVIIHGSNRGKEIKDALQVYASHPKVERIVAGNSSGETIFVLREL